jgi:hypothetical protein
MRGLVLDVDAIAFAKSLSLIACLESWINSLPEKACVELSVYREMVAQGLGPLIDGWFKAGVLNAPVDYRNLAGDTAFVRLGGREWRHLSRQDRASLVVAQARSAGLLTHDILLGKAAIHLGLPAFDVFDVIRACVKLGRMSKQEAQRVCSVWDDPRYRAGCPKDYRGTYDAECAHRDVDRPLS